jgi:hypothetical protein
LRFLIEDLFETGAAVGVGAEGLAEKNGAGVKRFVSSGSEFRDTTRRFTVERADAGFCKLLSSINGCSKLDLIAGKDANLKILPPSAPNAAPTPTPKQAKPANATIPTAGSIPKLNTETAAIALTIRIPATAPIISF